MTDETPDGTPEVGSLLFETGGHGDCDEAACMELVGVTEPSSVDVLFVTFTKSARQRLDAWKRYADAPPANVAIVSVDVGGDEDGGGDGGPPVRRVSDPADLTGVGIAISEFLSSWEDDGNRTVVCFESLTALLQYVDASRAFQFCNEMTSKFDRVDASAHFHVTPGAHETQDLSVLSSLFDDRVSAAGLGHTPESPDSTGAATGGSDPPEEEDPFEYVAEREDAADEKAGDDADAAAESADALEADTHEPEVQDADAPRDGAQDADTRKPEEKDVDAPDRDSDDVAQTDEGAENADGPTESADGAAETESADAAADLQGATPDDVADAVEAVDRDDTSEDGATGDTDVEADDVTRPDATSRVADPDETRRRLQFIGPNADDTADDASDDADPEESDQADDSPAGSKRPGFYPRTTATVVGVVVMLVLISILTTAVPMPIGTDTPAGDAADVSATPTPESTVAAGTATPEPTDTPDPTATATPTPEPSSGVLGSSGGSSDDGADSTSDGSTADGDDSSSDSATATPTATATPEPTPTESSDDGGLTDIVSSDEDDSTLGL